MLMAGKADFSKFKPYHELSANFNEDTSDIKVTEVKFQKTGDDITAFFVAEDIKGLYKAEEHTKDKLYYLTFHKGEYEAYDSKAKARVKTQPSLYENLVFEFFETEQGKEWLEKETVLSGLICIHSSEVVLNQIKAINGWNIIFGLTPVAEPKLLPKPEASAGYTRKGGNFQTEIQKLNDRKQFLAEQLGFKDNESLLDIAVTLQADGFLKTKTPHEAALNLIQTLIK